MRDPIMHTKDNHVRMYEDAGEYRVYSGMNMVCIADNKVDAEIEFQREAKAWAMVCGT